MFPSLDAMREARERIASVVRHTPAVKLNDRFGADDIHLKLETFQPIGSFKLRGVFNAVASLSDDERARGLSTVSAGNTAQALAWSGRHFGVTARSLMPDTAPRAKIDAVRALGGEPVLVPVDDVFRFLQQSGWESEPYAFIHPWTNERVLTGHASLGLEILDDVEDVETVYVPVGGGGLIAGVGAAIKAMRPDVRIVAVEPQGCPSFHESLKAGAPAAVPCETICDGVAVPYMTDAMFPRLRELADATRLVSERDVKGMVRCLALEQNVVAEASGALAVVAAVQEPSKERGRAVAIVSGASIDAAKLTAILADETLPNFANFATLD